MSSHLLQLIKKSSIEVNKQSISLKMGLFLYLIPIALYFFYKWATANYDFFKKQGIAFIKPLPLVGSNFELFFKKQPFVKGLMENYFKYKSDK